MYNVNQVVNYLDCPRKFAYGYFGIEKETDNEYFKRMVYQSLSDWVEDGKNPTHYGTDESKELSKFLVDNFPFRLFDSNVETVQTDSISESVILTIIDEKIWIVMPYITNRNRADVTEQLTFFNHRVNILSLLGSEYWGEGFGGVKVLVSKKSVPKPPTVLKSGKLSKAKNQVTTRKLYAKAVKDNGLLLEDYADIFNDWPFEDVIYTFDIIKSKNEIHQIYDNIRNTMNIMGERYYNTPKLDSTCIFCAYKEDCQAFTTVSISFSEYMSI